MHVCFKTVLPAQAAKKQIRGESLERIGTSAVSEVGLEQIKGLKAGMQLPSRVERCGARASAI